MPEIIPTHGATTVERIKESSVEVVLTEQDMEDIDSIRASCEVIGGRYHPFGVKLVNG